MVEADAGLEIQDAERFSFGANWRDFLSVLDDDRITAAEHSLLERLGREDLGGLTFLDAGSGSGLFSLAARRLGAEVTSFDIDPDSVACTEALRTRFCPADPAWRILHGSVLDEAFLATLGEFDVVYCWGVLHHTGAMYRALHSVSRLVKPGGQLFIAVYNDQGWPSTVWKEVKRRYNRASGLGRRVILDAVATYLRSKAALRAAARRNGSRSGARRPPRGMSRRHDLVDWVGGYPFEVAKPEEIFDTCHGLGFDLERLVTKGRGFGCNEYVFSKRLRPRRRA